MNASSIRQSRREFTYIILAWSVFMAWVIAYAKLYAYPEDPSQIRLLLGLPEWVVWGIALPWLLASAFSIWFALVVMQDLDPDTED